MKRIIIVILFILTLSLVTFSQEKPKFLTLNGYLTTLQSTMFDSLSGSFVNENLIHNRLNFRADIKENITFTIEFRNRLFTGDIVRSGRSYSSQVAADKGWADLSWNLLDERSFFLNTTIDRAWIDLNWGKFQARLGRQRINWGQTLIWNPNDIFNVYSFFDFDYIERPGSDAARIQYYPGPSSSIEIAIKADYLNHVTSAAIYRFNKWGYDVQFLAGYFNSEDIVAGTGWSGSVGSVSFRGEATLFKNAKHYADSAGKLILTTGLDKSFPNSSMIQAQMMFCNRPFKLSSFSSLYSGNLSTKDLAFSKFSVFGQFSYPTTPLLTLSVSAMWFPDLNGFFAGPSLEYSIAENLDFSLFWQHFQSRMGNERPRINLVFLRIKASF